MRLWHYELIPLLPKKMLVSQWRECIAIKRQWEKGTLKHRLVSYVMNYDKVFFIRYVLRVVDEMDKRKIKYNKMLFHELFNFCWKGEYINDLLNYKEHNDRYLKQCFYNLQEKADRGIITKDEWKKIENKFKE